MTTQSKNKVVPLRIPELLDEIAQLSAEEEHTDKATALRQWLHEGAEHYVVRLVSEGRISIGRATELLDKWYPEIYEIARKYDLELGPTAEQVEHSHQTLKALIETGKLRPRVSKEAS